VAKAIKYNNVPTIDRKIFDRLKTTIPELGDIELVAGVLLERYGNEIVEGTDLTYAQLMTIQELGTSTIPARPVVGAIVDSSTVHNHIQKTVTAALRDVVKNAVTGSKRMRAGDKILGQIGQYLVDAMKARIREGIDPPLAERTIRARERAGRPGTTPLYDTKHLINSFSWTVRAHQAGSK
jgi:hypothetical protein